MFNTVFGLPRNVENIARSFGTFESGSPPGQATIDRRWTEEPVFNPAAAGLASPNSVFLEPLVLTFAPLRLCVRFCAYG
jgi:hypothetical protein